MASGALRDRHGAFFDEYGCTPRGRALPPGCGEAVAERSRRPRLGSDRPYRRFPRHEQGGDIDAGDAYGSTITHRTGALVAASTSHRVPRATSLSRHPFAGEAVEHGDPAFRGGAGAVGCPPRRGRMRRRDLCDPPAALLDRVRRRRRPDALGPVRDRLEGTTDAIPPSRTHGDDRVLGGVSVSRGGQIRRHGRPTVRKPRRS